MSKQPIQMDQGTTSPRTIDEAARWFLRLQDETANAQTFIEWQQWLAASSEHRAAYDEIEDTALRLQRARARPSLPSKEELATDTYDGSQPIAQWRHAARLADDRARYRYTIAASLALISLIATFFWAQHWRAPDLGSFSYETAAGKRAIVALPDGSRITLDADSALQARLTSNHRALVLARGEAYFQVATDATRPFTVQAGSTQVTALGTAFNVRMSEDRTVVTVTEGKVELIATPQLPLSPATPQVSAPRLAAHVAAGEAVSYGDMGMRAIPAAEVRLATTWLEGRRQYRNEPLRYVLADVDRYTGRRIEIENDATGELRFTGTLDLQNSDAWLRALSVALPVEIVVKDNGSLLVAYDE